MQLKAKAMLGHLVFAEDRNASKILFDSIAPSAALMDDRNGSKLNPRCFKEEKRLVDVIRPRLVRCTNRRYALSTMVH